MSTIGTAADQYERKSVSYLNAVWLSTPEAKEISQKQVNFLLNAIKAEVAMERFDFNPLPKELITDFVNTANDQSHLSVDDIANLMQTKLMPTIKSILEGAMDERAGEFVSEEGRQTFMATKAKELGITLDEIEKVMNSAYIYLPILTKFEHKKVKGKNNYEVTLEGGIIWFHLDVTGHEPVIKLRLSQTTLSKGFGSEDFSFENATENFARNLEVATRSIPEFKLQSTIAEVDGGNITFGLGMKEGIKMDDCFLVGEWIDYGNGIEFEHSGWVRVGTVGHNQKNNINRSSGWAVKRGSWARGMSVVEHPRLRIDIGVKPMLYFMEVSKGDIPVPIFSGGYITIEEDFNDPAFGFDIDAHFNISRFTGSRQTFFLVGGNVATLPGLKFSTENDFIRMTTTPPFVWGFHGGIMKKWYVGQLAFTGAVKAGARYFTVEQDFTFGITDYTYTIQNNAFGVQFEVGLDWAATPDVNIGILGGFRGFADTETWTLAINPEVIGVTVWDDNFPKVNHSGAIFGLYIHYTPPELPFDPIGFIQGTLLDK